LLYKHDACSRNVQTEEKSAVLAPKIEADMEEGVSRLELRGTFTGEILGTGSFGTVEKVSSSQNKCV
jgi:hypothetical protein